MTLTVTLAPGLSSLLATEDGDTITTEAGDVIITADDATHALSVTLESGAELTVEVTP